MLGRSDDQLFDDWTAGDASAGRALFERHFARVFRYVRSRLNTSDGIDDLIQQTFLGCLEARGRFRGEATFQTFLLGIARHKVLGHHQRRKPSETIDSSIRDPATSPSGALGRREREEQLWRAIEQLPEELRQVLDLAYVDGFDGAKIAEILAIPVNTIYTRLHRARRLLRNALAEPL